MLKSTGEYGKAVQHYQRVLQLDAGNDAGLIGLADSYQKLGNPAAAEVAYKLAIQQRPNYWGPYSWLGVFYSNQGRYDEAAAMFRKVIDLAPENYRGYSNLGGVYTAQGLYPEAIVTLKRSIDLRPNLEAYGNLGAVYFFLHRYGEAADIFQQSLQLNHDDYMNWGNLGDALYWTPNRRPESTKAYQQAIRLTQAAMQANPRDAGALSYLGYYLAMMGDKKQAIDTVQQAVTLAPHNPDVLLRAASTSIHFGDQRQTLVWLQQAVGAGLPPSQFLDSPEFQPLQNNSEFHALAGKK